MMHGHQRAQNVTLIRKNKDFARKSKQSIGYPEIRKHELLSIYREIQLLGKLKKLPADYYRMLIIELVQENISENYEVGYGFIYDENREELSSLCDVLVYESKIEPAFKHQELVVVRPDDVKFAMQIKRLLNSASLKAAIKNLKSVKKLNSQINCWIIGFETNILLKTLYFKAWKSGAVDFLHVFISQNRKTENRHFVKNQMRFLIQFLRCYSKSYPEEYSNSLKVGINDIGQHIHLEREEKEENMRVTLSAIL